MQASIRGHGHQRKDRPYARFDIAGRVGAPLMPGVTAPVDVSLANHMRHELWISDLNVIVAVDAAHVAAGCSATRDFIVTQLPRSTYPIRLPARIPYAAGWPARLAWPGGRRWRLAQLGVAAPPTIAMINLPDIDQDACKGARLGLRFWATSRLRPRYIEVRAKP